MIKERFRVDIWLTDATSPEDAGKQHIRGHRRDHAKAYRGKHSQFVKGSLRQLAYEINARLRSERERW